MKNAIKWMLVLVIAVSPLVFNAVTELADIQPPWPIAPEKPVKVADIQPPWPIAPYNG